MPSFNKSNIDHIKFNIDRILLEELAAAKSEKILSLVKWDTHVEIIFFVNGSKPSVILRRFCTDSADSFHILDSSLCDAVVEKCQALFCVTKIDDIAFVEFCISRKVATDLVSTCGRNTYHSVLREWLYINHPAFTTSELQSNGQPFTQLDIQFLALVKSSASYKKLNDEFKKKYREIGSKVVASGEYKNRHINEEKLYRIVKSEYQDALHQFRAEWLGQQSLDIYIPSIKVGIEYQGEQHYRPVEHFGGQSVFEKQIDSDNRKREKCRENGVILIEWHYSEYITENVVLRKINDSLDAFSR